MKYSKIIVWPITVIIIFVLGCKKDVQVDPPVTQVDGAVAYSNDANATAVLTGLYMAMSRPGIFTGTTSITVYTGLSSDELTTYTGLNRGLLLAYENALSSVASSQGTPPMWGLLYNYIYTVNSAIDGISASSGLSDNVRDQLLGEAKFLRAFFYFYLVNLYGDIPLVTSSNYQLNTNITRLDQDQVYVQMITDLKDAQTTLSANFLASDLKTATTERTRPTKYAAEALLARVYLYYNDFVNAEAQSTVLISDSSKFTLVDSNSVFLANNSEAIWQLQPVVPGYNTYDALSFVLMDAPNGAQPTSLSSQLMNSFEPGDSRRTNWIDSINVSGQTYFYPFKYKSYMYDGTNPQPTEYLNIFRLAEQYLIRAEARAQQGKSSSVDDLNRIRNRANLEDYTGAVNKNALMSAILHERQVEFFAEMGHRWLDLKRTGLIDSVMNIVTPLKGGSWQSNWKLYPIPQSETLIDPNIKQNPGYQ